jgi:hypothetical protein
VPCQTEQWQTGSCTASPAASAACFFRSDFIDLGSPGQVGRALRALVQKDCLMQCGHGIYEGVSGNTLAELATVLRGR